MILKFPKENEPYDIGRDPEVISEEDICKAKLLIIHPKTHEALTDPLNFMPPLNFPEPEKHWHFKLRMFVHWLKGLPQKLRWTLFPYHLIHKDKYEEMF